MKGKNSAGEPINIVISRQSEFRIVDPKTEIVLYTHALPYGSTLFMADGAQVKKGDMICEWDPYNAVIISEYEGKAVYDSVIEGVTYRDERDEQTGLSEKVVIESKDRMKNPIIRVVNKEGEEVKQYNLPVGAQSLSRITPASRLAIFSSRFRARRQVRRRYHRRSAARYGIVRGAQSVQSGHRVGNRRRNLVRQNQTR